MRDRQWRNKVKKLRISMAVVLFILSATSAAQESVATGLFRTDLPDLAGREAVVLEVEYPPGVASSSHRHNAHTFVYVLEGTVVMAVAGGEPQTLVAGVFHQDEGCAGI
jgi:quercetin dioxygenase-like cupin family protein